MKLPGLLFAAFLVSNVCTHAADSVPPSAPGDLVARVRTLAGREEAFEPAYRPIYRAAFAWYEKWGALTRDPVDDWMMPPAKYATELADAVAQGRNYFREHPRALIPLAFETSLADGTKVSSNYWLNLPDGFPEHGRQFPLVISLHGSGWLGHRISFVGSSAADPRVFKVVPIQENGPWQIKALNAFLDELVRVLPIDADRVYVEGHSLGGMATWEWAMSNPERLAAISPRSAIGEPYRAARLKNLPAWVIHGERDDVISPGFAEQMVTALQACGGRVRYSLLSGVEHNMPSDLDESQVIDWYLRQARPTEPSPTDPRDGLAIEADGYSNWQVDSLPAGWYWHSEDVDSGRVASADPSLAGMVNVLFRQAHATGRLVDGSLLQRTDGKVTCFWLAVPGALHADSATPTGAVRLDARRAVRFVGRGSTKAALAHVEKITPALRAAGYAPKGVVWIKLLSLPGRRADSSGNSQDMAEYAVEIE